MQYHYQPVRLTLLTCMCTCEIHCIFANTYTHTHTRTYTHMPVCRHVKYAVYSVKKTSMRVVVGEWLPSVFAASDGIGVRKVMGESSAGDMVSKTSRSSHIQSLSSVNACVWQDFEKIMHNQ